MDPLPPLRFPSVYTDCLGGKKMLPGQNSSLTLRGGSVLEGCQILGVIVEARTPSEKRLIGLSEPGEGRVAR